MEVVIVDGWFATPSLFLDFLSYICIVWKQPGRQHWVENSMKLCFALCISNCLTTSSYGQIRILH